MGGKKYHFLVISFNVKHMGRISGEREDNPNRKKVKEKTMSPAQFDQNHLSWHRHRGTGKKEKYS